MDFSVIFYGHSEQYVVIVSGKKFVSGYEHYKFVY